MFLYFCTFLQKPWETLIIYSSVLFFRSEVGMFDCNAIQYFLMWLTIPWTMNNLAINKYLFCCQYLVEWSHIHVSVFKALPSTLYGVGCQGGVLAYYRYMYVSECSFSRVSINVDPQTAAITEYFEGPFSDYLEGQLYIVIQHHQNHFKYTSVIICKQAMFALSTQKHILQINQIYFIHL